jgi:hypothetical protein
VLAAIGNGLPEPTIDPLTGARSSTTLFIVASPRPATGKTFLARLVADFRRMDGGAVEAFELSPGDVPLSDHLPALVTRAELDGTRGQMALFDRLILADGVARVVDVGHIAFLRFFTLLDEIGFATEAVRRGIEFIVLFAADPHVHSVNAYAALQRWLPTAVLAPVFNDGILKGRKLRGQYPITRAASVPLQIPLLPPAVKLHAERSGLSFVDFNDQLPAAVPIGAAFELRSWTRRTFLEFRELELRLLMEKLRASLTL